MMAHRYFSQLLLGLLAFLGAGAQAFAQVSLIEVDCSTTSAGNTSCFSSSQDATTASSLFPGLGAINAVSIRNVDAAPVSIRNLANTSPMTLFGEIDNLGYPQGLAISLAPSFNQATAPGWMAQAPNAGNALIVADSVGALDLSVQGYSGKAGRALSRECGDLAVAAKSAATVASCQAQAALGLATGFYPNASCDPSIIAANQAVAAAVGADGSCTASTMAAIALSAPASFCPADHFYLSGRDGLAQPQLSSSQSIGNLLDFLDNPVAEAPVRLRYLQECVSEQVYRSCSYSGAIPVAAPAVSFIFSDPNNANNPANGKPARVVACVGQALSIAPSILPSPVGSGTAANAIASCLVSSGALPAGLSINATTCAISGTLTAPAPMSAISVVATNIAGASLPASLSLEVDPSNGACVQPAALTFLTPTPGATTVINFSQAVDNLVASCSTEYAALQASGAMPPDSLAALCQATNDPNGYQQGQGGASGPCITALETSTLVRDVANYYGAPVLTFSAAARNFAEGQVAPAGSGALASVSIAGTEAGASFSSCQAVPGPGSGAAAALPPGLAVSLGTIGGVQQCVVSGTFPAAEYAMQPYYVTATDSNGNTSSPASFAMSVSPGSVIGLLSYPSAAILGVVGQPLTINPALSAPTGVFGASLACREMAANIGTTGGLLPSGLSLSPSCVISGTPTAAASQNQYYFVYASGDPALPGTLRTNSALVTIEIDAQAPAASSSSPSSQNLTCPGAGEAFEAYTQSHIVEPYTSVALVNEYEEIPCAYGSCPGANDTYTFDQSSSVALPIEAGEAGSFGGAATVIAYDVAQASFAFANGSNGANGVVDIAPQATAKYCAKVVDARGLNGQAPQAPGAGASPYIPSVNFHQSSYTPFSYTLPATVPGTAFPQRTQSQAIGLYKKVDSSVRQYIIDQYIGPRFQ